MKVLTVAVTGLAALVLGVVLGAMLLGGEPTPTDGSPEAGFARDMSVHHEQAVELAFIVRDQADDPEVRAMAYDIINTQRAQIGMFSGWLQQWDLPITSTAPPMAWTDSRTAWKEWGAWRSPATTTCPAWRPMLTSSGCVRRTASRPSDCSSS